MHSSVRPEVVLLLTTLDLNHPGTRQRPYHRDGRPFTLAERDLLITFTPEEKAAAIAQIELEDEWQRELDEIKDAFVDLLMKYFAKLPEGSVVSDAVAIMTDEDYARFEHLAEIATAEDTLEFRALYEGS
ncbi:hypothetical protein ACGFZL_03715 [Streptomyces sp. NPDC048182]|uniref:hypothetical protein n=1 Tax=Streptomyces sp. NPDC048182 TaxID=3365507 RepID=UPI003714B59C